MKGRHQPKLIGTAAALALGLGISQTAAAASLGPIAVNSYIGQPLKASISLSGMTAAEAAGAVVTLAPASEYSKRNVVRTADQSSMNFRVVKSGGGYVIAVSSSKRITEPFIDFVLQVKSGGQTTVREYSAFLDQDPAVAAGIVPAAPAEPAAPAPVAKKPSKEIIAKPAAAPAAGWGGTGVGAVVAGAAPVALNGQASADTSWKESRREQPVPAPRTSYSGSSYTVKRGETLYSIANAVRPSNVSVQTMQRALFNANRRAFATSSMDSLMAGQTLVIPRDAAAAAALRSESSKKRDNRKEDAAKAAEKPAAQKTDSQKEVIEVTAEKQEPKSSSKIAQALDNAAKTDEAVVPAVMPDAPAPAEAQGEVPAEQGAETAGSGMQIDGVDAIDAPHAETPADAPAADTAPAVPAETPAVEEAPKPAETPAPAETPKPAPAPAPAVSGTEDTGLPFGLQLWQLLTAGVALLAALLLALVLKSKRKTPELEISDSELDQLAREMEASETATGLHGFNADEGSLSQDDLAALEAAVQSTEAPAVTGDVHGQSAFDNEFFKDMDGEPAAAAAAVPAAEEVQFDELDDFFSQNRMAAETAPVQDDSFSSADDFFAESAPEKADADSFGTEDFFAEDAPVKAPETAAQDFFAEDNKTAAGFDDDFFNESEALRDTPAAGDAASEENILAEDFFAEDSQPAETAAETEDFFSTDVLPAQHTADFGHDFFAEETPAAKPAAAEPAVDFFAEEAPAAKSAEPAPAAKPAEPAAADFFAEDVPAAAAPAVPVSGRNPTAADIQAMDINIDLASAYIKSGVKPEKARAWLEEVMDRGTLEQKSIAADLLKQIS